MEQIRTSVYIYVCMLLDVYFLYLMYYNIATCEKSGAHPILASFKRSGTFAQHPPKEKQNRNDQKMMLGIPIPAHHLESFSLAQNRTVL